MKKILNLSLYFLIISPYIIARAGGAGGRSSSSRSYSSSSSFGGSSSGPMSLPVFIIVVIFIIGAALVEKKKAVGKKEIQDEEKNKEKEAFLERNPEFNEEVFLSKVTSMFLNIQYAWENKDLSRVRNSISDGVYQKFNTQLMMMDELKQKNTIEDVRVKSTKITKYEIDGDYDVVYVAINAFMKDSFVCELDSRMNRKSEEEFTEYWAFIRKKGRDRSNAHLDDSCPNCGAKLDNIENIEVAKCPYCESIINSGEYDWVLSEIYQRESLINYNKDNDPESEFNKIRSLLSERDKEFSKQLLEDKVSNAMVQIDKAIALCKPELARRFVTDNVYNQLESNIRDIDGGFYYNTYYFDGAFLKELEEKDEFYYAMVEIYKKSEKVKREEGRLKSIDTNLVTSVEKIYLKRKVEVENKAGNLYANSCPNCAGLLTDTIDTHCPYCNELIVDPKYDWIVYKREETRY